MSQLTQTFLLMLFGPITIALLITGAVVLLEKREERHARIYRQLTQTPPPPRKGRPALQLVRNP